MRRIYVAVAAALAVLSVPAIATGDSILRLADTGRQAAGDTTAATETMLAPEGNDELELKGTITSLSPLTVTAGARTAACSVPDDRSLAGFAIGDFVEIACDLRAGAFALRELTLEDDQVRPAEDDVDDVDTGAEDDIDEGNVENQDNGNVNDVDDEDQNDLDDEQENDGDFGSGDAGSDD